MKFNTEIGLGDVIQIMAGAAAIIWLVATINTRVDAFEANIERMDQNVTTMRSEVDVMKVRLADLIERTQ